MNPSVTLKPEAQWLLLERITGTLSTYMKDLRKSKDSSMKDCIPEYVVEDLLDAIVEVLEVSSGDDVWGTEGWEHFFGVEEQPRWTRNMASSSQTRPGATNAGQRKERHPRERLPNTTA